MEVVIVVVLVVVMFVPTFDPKPISSSGEKFSEKYGRVVVICVFVREVRAGVREVRGVSL